MTELQALTVADFAATVGDRYALDLDGAGTVELVLEEATDLADPGMARPTTGTPDLRAPFSLVFRGPAEPVLAQRTYAIAHATLGALVIFLVPIARTDDGMRYEAIFA